MGDIMNGRTKVTDLFSREEIKMLTTKSDLMGAWAVGSTWVVIGLTFAGVAWAWPQIGITGKFSVFILALIILGGRQLALGIITHDASHSTLFKTQWLNDYLVNWLCARPVWNQTTQLSSLSSPTSCEDLYAR
jgi:fatty acid desaturase